MGTGDIYRSAKMARWPNEYITVMDATSTAVSFSEGLYPNVTPSSKWTTVTAADFETKEHTGTSHTTANADSDAFHSDVEAFSHSPP